MLVGNGAGIEGVIVAVIEAPALTLAAVYTTLNGDAGLSTKVEGSGMVTIKPVASTVGVTVGSLETRVKVVSAAKAEPAGASVPVYTSVFPATGGSNAMGSPCCVKLIDVGNG